VTFTLSALMSIVDFELVRSLLLDSEADPFSLVVHGAIMNSRREERDNRTRSRHE